MNIVVSAIHQTREDLQVRGASVNHDFYILAIDIRSYPPVQSARKLGSRDGGCLSSGSRENDTTSRFLRNQIPDYGRQSSTI